MHFQLKRHIVIVNIRSLLSVKIEQKPQPYEHLLYRTATESPLQDGKARNKHRIPEECHRWIWSGVV